MSNVHVTANLTVANLRHPSGLPVIAAMPAGMFWTRDPNATAEQCAAASCALLKANPPNLKWWLPPQKVEN